MRILFTGFDPFGGETMNPSFEAVKRMPDMVSGAEIIKMEIPTSFLRGVSVMEEAIRFYQPDAVVNVGQAGGRSCVTVERVAINLADARMPDNDGAQPVDRPLQPDGPAAYFATIPVKDIVQRIRSHGIACDVSCTAGTYVCNCVMYYTLHLAATRYPRLRAGFIHVPYSDKQAAGKPSGTPGISLQGMSNALEYAAEAIVLDRGKS
ncbi:MAG: pyroglutamyl-peptidase I [Candidatus Onthomonas sp.]